MSTKKYNRPGLSKIKDDTLIGKKFGSLIVLEPTDEFTSYGHRLYLCNCNCGNIHKAIRRELLNGNVKSCGCMKAEYCRKASSIHGQSNKKLWKIWYSAKERCFNPKNPSYHNYGDRGITMCSEWKTDYSKFEKWALSHDYKDGLSLERNNVDGHYEPDNCCWIPKSDQCKNRRITLRLPDGRPLKDVCRECGMTETTVLNRLLRGMSVEEALTTPTQMQIWQQRLNGKRLSQLCREYNMPYKTVYERVVYGNWDLRKALTTPKSK